MQACKLGRCCRAPFLQLYYHSLTLITIFRYFSSLYYSSVSFHFCTTSLLSRSCSWFSCFGSTAFVQHGCPCCFFVAVVVFRNHATSAMVSYRVRVRVRVRVRSFLNARTLCTTQRHFRSISMLDLLSPSLTLLFSFRVCLFTSQAVRLSEGQAQALAASSDQVWVRFNRW